MIAEIDRSERIKFGMAKHPQNSSATEQFITVLDDAIKMLVVPDNDFNWSRWSGAEEAVSEIKSHIASIRSGDLSRTWDLSILFAATGPIQEVSMSSGWGDEFLTLAERFDAAADRLEARRAR
jgi:hypothetical protein